jgi:hypothetical protein
MPKAKLNVINPSNWKRMKHENAYFAFSAVPNQYHIK